MSKNDTKTLLLLDSSGGKASFPILFHCARYWAAQGKRVLFISETPPKCLPFTLGDGDSTLDPDSFKLIQFMYLANSTELLQQLYSIHLRHNPVSVIIVKSLENYFNNQPDEVDHEDHVSLICASLLYAVSMCARIISRQSVLISEYVSEDSTIEKNIVGSFFHNVWELQRRVSDKTTIKLSKLSPAANNEVVAYTFSENKAESVLKYEEIVKKILT